MRKRLKRFNAGVPKWPKGQVNLMEDNEFVFLDECVKKNSVGSAKLKALAGKKSCVLVTSRVRIPSPAFNFIWVKDYD